MAIQSTDILYKLSVTTGPGNSTAQGDPDASLGEFMSSTEMNLGTPLNNLFDDVTGDENAASDVEYRCIFIHNNHASLTLQSAVIWMSAEVSGGCDIAIAASASGVVDEDSASAQAEEIADEGDSTNQLTGLSFSSPTSKGAGISLGDIPAGDCIGIWVRRTANDTSAVDNDGATLKVEGDTAA